MAILFKGVVANCYSLNVRTGPGVSFPAVAWLQRGDSVTVDGKESNWYKLQGQTRYCEQSYIQVTEDLTPKEEAAVVEEAPAVLAVEEPVDPFATIKLGSIVGGTTVSAPSTASSVSGRDTVNIKDGNGDDDGSMPVERLTNSGLLGGRWGHYYLHTNRSYPVTKYNTTSGPAYDWYMNHELEYNGRYSMVDLFKTVQKNLNISSYYNREELNKKVHENFNRFRIEFPDIYLRNTTSIVIFTRPDLNIFADDGGKTDMIASDPRCNLIITRNRKVAELLTRDGPGTSHKFNPLLSNLAQSLEVSDDSVDLLDIGETFTGYKMQYSKHNIKSITNGSISVKYKETFDLAVTNMHQLWVDYQSNVYKGVFEPKREYIYNKELDYACDVYYFLLDQDGETIKFWTKYYGVFPNNVPKAAFSFDYGSQVQFPELNVTYSYIYKEDLSPVALIEFNENAGVEVGSYQDYVKTLNAQTTGLMGQTWVGKPFIYSFQYNNGFESVQGFKIGWKKA